MLLREHRRRELGVLKKDQLPTLRGTNPSVPNGNRLQAVPRPPASGTGKAELSTHTSDIAIYGSQKLGQFRTCASLSRTRFDSNGRQRRTLPGIVARVPTNGGLHHSGIPLPQRPNCAHKETIKMKDRRKAAMGTLRGADSRSACGCCWVCCVVAILRRHTRERTLLNDGEGRDGWGSENSVVWTFSA
jgi:hypothetical protein